MCLPQLCKIFPPVSLCACVVGRGMACVLYSILRTMQGLPPDFWPFLSCVCVCGGGRRVCPLSACKKYTQLVSRDRKEGRPRVCSTANLLLRQTLRGLSGYRYLYHYNSDTIWQGLSRSKTLTQTKFEGFVWLPVYHYNSDKIWQGCPVANLLHRQNLRGLFGYRYITIIQTNSGRVVQSTQTKFREIVWVPEYTHNW